jgi:hypothetical protein
LGQPDKSNSLLIFNESVIDKYYSPINKIVYTSATGAWYNNAKNHKPLGFDVMVNIAYMPVPNNKFEFYTEHVASDEGSLPTVLSDKSAYLLSSYGGDSYAMLLSQEKTINSHFTSNISANLGLFKGSEIAVKYMIPFTNFYGKSTSWGLGYKNDIFETFNISVPPVFATSVLFSYSNYKIKQVQYYNESISSNSILPVINKTEDKYLKINNDIFMLAPVFGVNMPVISFYGSVGIIFVKRNYKFYGEYLVREDDSIILRDNFEVKSQINKSAVRYNAGARLRLGLIAINIDYNYTGYSLYNLGLGITLR